MPHEIDRYVLPAAVTLAGTYQLAKFARAVGAARYKFNVSPPDVTGPPEFLRTYRAHQNTFEFYPMSLTSLWLGSVFFHPVPSSLLYTGYLYGRHKYFKGYVEDADKRLSGFILSKRCLIGLMILSLLGIGHKAIRYFHGADVLKLAQERLGWLSGFIISSRCLVGLMILCLLGISHKAIRYFHGADVLKLAQERLGY